MVVVSEVKLNLGVEGIAGIIYYNDIMQAFRSTPGSQKCFFKKQMDCFFSLEEGE